MPEDTPPEWQAAEYAKARLDLQLEVLNGVSRRGGGSRLAGFVPSAVWPPCARVTVAMERLAATGRTEARSAEAPRAVLDPAA